MQKEGMRDHNILDILARIRRRDLERGEEVLQHHPISPLATASNESEILSPDGETNLTNNEANRKEISRRARLEESLWYAGLESEQMFGPLDAVFDGFGGPSLTLDSQELEQLYTEQL
jgi:hypothetical protein